MTIPSLPPSQRNHWVYLIMFKNCGANPLRKGGLTRFDQVFGNTQSTPLRIITARERKLQVRAVANQMLQMQRAKKAENR